MFVIVVPRYPPAAIPRPLTCHLDQDQDQRLSSPANDSGAASRETAVQSLPARGPPSTDNILLWTPAHSASNPPTTGPMVGPILGILLIST